MHYLETCIQCALPKVITEWGIRVAGPPFLAYSQEFFVRQKEICKMFSEISVARRFAPEPECLIVITNRNCSR